ncbi:MAG TPA: sodium:solute symporter family protein [Woeseiaceae bacterium]|nr:sodium:solute symporter family protein [Woeseiaceae bacterium]
MTTDTILAGIDWLIIAVLIVVSIAIGFVVRDDARTGGIEGFFAAGRRMRWWFLGTSIVATTFASDTPLAITGWISQYGIAGNWWWWSQLIAMVAMTVFFARKWRVAGVLTDAEIAELRYGGKAATTLRAIKAFLNVTFVNFVILGWVFAGMAKISEPFMDWRALLGGVVYDALAAAYPDFLLFHNFDNTLTIILLVLATLIYSSVGGIRAVIITDLVQFSFAMGMSILLSWLAVRQVGGLDAAWAQLAELYPSGETGVSTTGERFLSHEQVASFIPDFGSGVAGSLGIPFSAFVLTLGFMWWTNGNVDGSGFVAQRLYTARDGGEAEKGALWFTVAHFAVRTWPWVLAGVVALVLYPRAEVNELARDFTACAGDRAACTAEMNACLENRYTCTLDGYTLLVRDERTGPGGATVVEYREDRERGYPALIRDILPPGLLGLALASLMAAFMSTVSTHINWGASYVANDFYYRFVNPRASNRHLTFVSRLATVVIALLAIYIATFVDNIGAMWELWGGLLAGLGLPHLLRWLWWRANVWTEITGMLVGFAFAFANYLVGQTVGFPDGQMSVLPAFMASHPIHVICWISLAAGVASLVVTRLTPPVKEAQLARFVERVQPMGFWRDLGAADASGRSLLASCGYWVLGTVAIYLLMFGLGFVFRLEPVKGYAMLAAGLVALGVMIRGMAALDRRPKGVAARVA